MSESHDYVREWYDLRDMRESQDDLRDVIEL